VLLGIPALLDFYRAHREDEALVLATIIGTVGSTYRKPGAMMLISRDGAFEGMISGGCLEGDLLHHAAEVFTSGEIRFVTYDMHADEDLVWSLGLGCDGVIHLMLQRLDRLDDFGFLRRLEKAHSARQAVVLALVTKADARRPAGSLAMLGKTDISEGDGVLLVLMKERIRAWPAWRYRMESFYEQGGAKDFMLVHMPVQTRVLICGPGPDTVPVARVLAELDWEVQIIDHRPTYAKAERFPGKCRVIQSRPEGLSDAVDLDEVDAAVVMSHHLENDAAYLKQLAACDIPYIGVLGPRSRRDRLREMAQCQDRPVFGPVGLDIGAELPAAIALSVAAEIHAVLNQRDGLPLTRRTDEHDA